MNASKWIGTLDSRKAVAMGIAFVLVALNKILAWEMETGDLLLLVSPLFAWAGIEGMLDLVNAKGLRSGGHASILPKGPGLETPGESRLEPGTSPKPGPENEGGETGPPNG